MNGEKTLENLKETGSIFHSSYAALTKESFKEIEGYMYSIYVTFNNLSKRTGYMHPIEANRLKGWLSELYENITMLESRLEHKAEYWEELMNEQTRVN